MNKKLLTLAVAAAMAAPVAAMADATLYGKIHMSIDYLDVDANADEFGPGSVTSAKVPGGVPTESMDVGVQLSDGTVLDSADLADIIADPEAFRGSRFVFLPGTGAGYKGWDLNSHSSRLGVKGSEDLGNGLKAVYQIELNIPMSNNDGDIDNGDQSDIKMRNSFVGLAGDWGTFLIGRHDTALKISTGKLDLFNDGLGDYSNFGFQDLRVDNTIAYISPSFSGFQFMAMTIPSGGATPIGSNVDTDGIADAWSLAAIYSNGPFYASAAYESLGDKHWDNLNQLVTFPGDTQPTESYEGIYRDSADDWTYWRIGLGMLDWNGFTLSGIYEAHSNVAGAPTDADMDLWQIQSGYAFGNNMVKAAYGQTDVDACVGDYAGICSAAAASVESIAGLPAGTVPYLDNQDFDHWMVGFDHSFSKRTQAYIQYISVDADQKDSDWNAWSLGMIHKF